MDLWALTSAGVQRLAAVRRSGELTGLPESPQHRVWREGQSAAGRHIDRLRDQLRGALLATIALLDAEPPPDSDAWFGASRTLQDACDRVGSATHCLYEWPEPDDAQADVAPEQYRGRRNFRGWAGA